MEVFGIVKLANPFPLKVLSSRISSRISLQFFTPNFKLDFKLAIKELLNSVKLLKSEENSPFFPELLLVMRGTFLIVRRCKEY